MASIDYEEIFGSFLENITDHELTSKSISEAYQIMTGYLHKALSNMYIYHLFSDITLSDDVQTVEYEMSHSINDAVDREFAVTILGKGMVQAWVSPKVQSLLLTAQMFAGKEQQLRVA